MADKKDKSGKTSGQTGSQSGNPRNQQLQREHNNNTPQKNNTGNRSGSENRKSGK